MNTIKIVGLDIAIRNVGLALGEYNIHSDEWVIRDVRLVQTTLNKELLKSVRKSSEDLRAATEIAQALQLARTEWAPSFFVGEVPSGAQSARAAFCFGMVTGLLGAANAWNNPALIEVSPAEVQKAALGYRGKDKDAIIAWATEKWPELPWIRRNFRGQLRLVDKNEHMADACAAVKAGIETQQFKQALALYRQMNRAA